MIYMLMPPYGTEVKNTIDKFQMVATANASDVGDLTQVNNYSAGVQH